MLEEFVRPSGDPDVRVFYSSASSVANGVPLEVNEKLPRTPAVFFPQVQVARLQRRARAQRAAETNSEALEQQFLQEEKLGAMVK